MKDMGCVGPRKVTQISYGSTSPALSNKAQLCQISSKSHRAFWFLKPSMILSILFHLLGLDLIISFVLPPLFHELSLLGLFHPWCVLIYSVYLQLHVFPFLHIFRQYTRCHPHSTDLARAFLIYLCHDVPSPFWRPSILDFIKTSQDTYPYFLRTVPPDSIQGQAFWNWIVAFEVRNWIGESASLRFCFQSISSDLT